MEHSEYVRLVPGARTAVMFLHGIVGTPNHFRDLLPLQQEVPEDWSVYNVLLPGHGGSVEDFGRSSMKQWKEKVWQVFGLLAESHERVFIVGHSMGTLFAMQLALEHPEKIPYLFLVAAPMRPYLGYSATINSLRLTFGKLRQDHPKEMAIALACGAEPTLLLWKYLPWIPRFVELFTQVYKTGKVVEQITVPSTVWQSARDELVAVGARRVLEKNDRFQIHMLSDSAHFYYPEKDRETLLRAFREICVENG